MTKHFIRFFFRGSFVSETSQKEVKGRSIKGVVIPAHAYSYQFFDKTVVKQNGETLEGKEHNFSPTTYFGEEYDLARVKREMPNERILISNMEGNGYKRVVKTKTGGMYPLSDGDRVEATCG